MRIDTSTPLLDFDGEPIMTDRVPDLPVGARVAKIGEHNIVADADGNVLFAGGQPPLKDGREVTFGYLGITILRKEAAGDEKLADTKKYDMFELAMILRAPGVVELNGDQAKLLRERAALMLPKETFWAFARLLKQADAACVAASAPGSAEPIGAKRNGDGKRTSARAGAH